MMRIRAFFISIAGGIACLAGCAGGICAAGGEMYSPGAVSILEDPNDARSPVSTAAVPAPYVSQSPQVRPQGDPTSLTINGRPVVPRDSQYSAPQYADPLPQKMGAGNVPSAEPSTLGNGTLSVLQAPGPNAGRERSILVQETNGELAPSAALKTAESTAAPQTFTPEVHSAVPQTQGNGTRKNAELQKKLEISENAGSQENAGNVNVWRILPDSGPDVPDGSVSALGMEYADGRPGMERHLANGLPMEMIPENRSETSAVPPANDPRSISGISPELHPGAQWTVQPENAVGNSAEKAVSPKSMHPLPRYVVAKAEPASELEKTLNPHPDLEKEREEMMRELKKHNKILKAQANVVKLAAKIIRPSVVHIQSDMLQTGNYGERLKVHDEGSGIIIRRQEKFFVLTNQHVIKNALPKNIEIRLSDNRITHPTKILSDQETDIAVLELAETDLIPAALGDSNQVDIGDFVLAVGSPFGLDNSVTFGIVSAIGRRTISLASNVSLQDFIQTDAAINPGNSGGPLLDLNAEVIGMNTAIASNSGNNAGIAFSIPIRMVTLVADQLIMYGKTRRAYLGVNLEKNFTIQQAREIGLERPRGALVTTVLNPSPAYQAKFRKGDLILEFNGIPVEDDMHLYNLVNLTEIDEKVTLKVYRAGEIYEVEVQLWER